MCYRNFITKNRNKLARTVNFHSFISCLILISVPNAAEWYTQGSTDSFYPNRILQHLLGNLVVLLEQVGYVIPSDCSGSATGFPPSLLSKMGLSTSKILQPPVQSHSLAHSLHKALYHKVRVGAKKTKQPSGSAPLSAQQYGTISEKLLLSI